jgi:regulatory protein
MKNETRTDKSNKQVIERGKKLPKKATLSHLENAALYYVERFSSTAHSLRQVLTRRVHKSAHYHDTDIDQGLEWVSNIVERFQRSGFIDDRIFSEARARSLHQRGNSAKTIRVKLMTKGVSSELIDNALQVIDDDSGGESGDSELQAAGRLAKRRRLGPFGDKNHRAELREKHLAALARAGFSYDIAIAVIDRDDD